MRATRVPPFIATRRQPNESSRKRSPRHHFTTTRGHHHVSSRTRAPWHYRRHRRLSRRARLEQVDGQFLVVVKTPNPYAPRHPRLSRQLVSRKWLDDMTTVECVLDIGDGSGGRCWVRLSGATTGGDTGDDDDSGGLTVYPLIQNYNDECRTCPKRGEEVTDGHQAFCSEVVLSATAGLSPPCSLGSHLLTRNFAAFLVSPAPTLRLARGMAVVVVVVVSAPHLLPPSPPRHSNQRGATRGAPDGRRVARNAFVVSFVLRRSLIRFAGPLFRFFMLPVCSLPHVERSTSSSIFSSTRTRRPTTSTRLATTRAPSACTA